MPVQNVSFGMPQSDLAVDDLALQRKIAMANMLRQNALATSPNETVSGIVVKQSPIQGLARLAQALASNKMMDSADEERRALVGQQQQRLADTLQAFGQEQDPDKRAMLLAQNPQTMPQALSMLDTNQRLRLTSAQKMEEMKAKAEEQKALQAERLAAQREMEQSRLEDRRMSREESNALRRELAAQASADRRMIAGITAARQEQKNTPKLPTAALKMQQEELDAIGTSATINADLGALMKQIEDKKLDLGPVSNITSKAKNFLGASDEQSRNLASFQSTLEKLRNDSLRLNKGIQTEGDAQRAWNELVANINDPKLVKQRLGEIQKINERAANLRKMNVENIRSNFGVEPLDTSGYQKQAPAVGGGESNIDALLKKYGG